MSSRAPFCSTRAAALSLLVTVLTAGTAGALDLNGFLPARGHGAVAFAYTGESYDEFWAGTMKVFVPDVGEVTTDSFTTWMTWGFTDDLALVLNLAYVDVTSDGLAGFEDSGLQDGAVLAKYRFASFQRGNASHSFLGAAGLRTPLSSYEGNAPVSLGDDTTDTLVRFIYHLESGRFYYSQQVGYDLRSDDAPEGIPIYAELGWSTGRATLTLLYSQYFADGGTDIGDPGFTFPSNKDEYQRVGAKAFIRLGERYGVSLLGFTTLDGRNSGDATGFSAGLSVDF
ncbi:MAG TPA: hypothetical protein VGG06_20190 [Thermoanaerobaculia bacterium]|jgi:hypothetical protein